MSKKLPESVYKSSELMKIIGKRGIQRALDDEEIFLLERGYYITPKMPYDIQAYYFSAGKFHPEAVISKNSALFFYGLSEHLPERIDLDVPRESKYRNENNLFKFHRVADSKIFDVEEFAIKGQKIKIYSLERALFECLYYEPKARGQRSSYAARHFVNENRVSIAKIAESADRLNKCGHSGVYDLLNIINVLNDDKSIY